MTLQLGSIRKRLMQDVALRVGLASALASFLALLLLSFVVCMFLIDRLETRIENSLTTRHKVSLRNAVDLTAEDHAVVHKYRRSLPVRDEGVFSWIDKEGNTFSGSVTGLDCRQGFYDYWLNIELSVASEPLKPLAPDKIDYKHHDRFRFIGMEREQGCLVFGQSLYEVDTINNSMKGLLLWLIPLCLLPALLIALRQSWSLRARLRAFGATVKEVSTGDLSARVKVNGNDDLDRLAVSTNRSFDRLQDSVSTLQQLTSVMAHDLRAPLNRIAIPLDKALRANEDGIPDVNSLESVKEGLFDARAVFEALLRISQIESGRRREHFKQVDLFELTETLYEIYQPVVEDAHRTLQFEVIGKGESRISGDSELIKQALVNLIENAIRYAPKGAVILISVIRDAHHPSIIVRDDGQGIPASERQNVLRRLYRYEASTNGQSGHGLGLSLVKAVVDLHHGELILSDAKPGLLIKITFSTPAHSAV